MSLQSLSEVEDFVDFIGEPDKHRVLESDTKLSEESFRHLWANEGDAAYDSL